MEPIEFEGSNVIIDKDQPQYLPLPAKVSEDGMVTSCWKLSMPERLALLLTGKLYLHVLTFNRPLQPMLPTVSGDRLDVE